MGLRIENGDAPAPVEEDGGDLRYDPREVIDRLCQQIGGLTAELAVRDAIITQLRGELAAAGAT